MNIDYGIKRAINVALNNFKAKKLLIDVRGNGGGIVPFGLSILSFLFKDWNENPQKLMDMFPIDVRKTPTFDLLSELLYELFTPMTSLLNFVSDAQWYNANETYM